MEKYIPLDALVTEIEKQRNTYISEPSKYKVLSRILSFLDTIEVKDVDLEKEANEAWDYIFSSGWDENSRMALKHDEYMAFAKHFFELGRVASNGS